MSVIHLQLCDKKKKKHCHNHLPKIVHLNKSNSWIPYYKLTNQITEPVNVNLYCFHTTECLCQKNKPINAEIQVCMLQPFDRTCFCTLLNA